MTFNHYTKFMVRHYGFADVSDKTFALTYLFTESYDMTFRVLLLALLAIPNLTMAGVNPKNGNFYISYTDIVQKSATYDLNLIRTYNSKAAYLGWFGYGWGSNFETRLTVMPDSSVVVTENGAGKNTFYRPAKGADVVGGVSKMVSSIANTDHLSESDSAVLRDKLLQDEGLRLQKVERYGLKYSLPIATILQGSNCPESALTRVAEGYKRVDCQGRIDWFNLQGHLSRYEFGDGYAVSVIYEGNRPKEIRDILGQSLTFSWSEKGLATTAEGLQTTGRYEYDHQNNLIKWKDVSGNAYEYEYDNNHNLTAVIYLDHTRMAITYDDNSAATSVTERDGSKTTYEYRNDPEDYLHYWTRITLSLPNGESTSREFEFKSQVDAKGSETLIKAAESSAIDRSEIKFDDKGRVIHQVNGEGESVDYDYDKDCGKLSQVIRNNNETTFFDYDKACNLISAEKNKQNRIELKYYSDSKAENGSPLIKRMIDYDLTKKTKRILTFKYNKQHKPVEINLVGVGRIWVEYDANGEISNVESNKGPKMALQVTRAFQNLLSVVKVAGIRMSL